MAKIQKEFFCSIFLLGSIYIPNFRKFYQTVWILPIFLIFCQFWLLFWPKKKAKRGQNRKIVFFVEFSFVGKHLHTKFQKNYQTVWILPIFFNFCQFWLFLAKKAPKMPKSKNCFLQHFLLLGSIYLPNFRKFHQTVLILPIFFIFGQF